MKKPLRFVLIGVVSLLLLLALVVALALTPGVQTWAARKFAPASPALTVAIGSVNAGLNRTRVENIRVVQPGLVLTIPSAEVEVSVIDAAGGKIEVKRLVAKGWTLDLTAPLAATTAAAPGAGESKSATPAKPVAPASPAAKPEEAARTAFNGLFKLIQLPFDLAVDGVDLSGDVILPQGRGPVSVTGGGIAAGKDGKFTLAADFKSADASAVSVRGDLTARMATARTFDRFGLSAAASVQASGVGKSAVLALSLSAANESKGEAYAVAVRSGEHEIATVEIALPPGTAPLAGSWKLDLGQADLAPFFAGRPLPEFVTKGQGTFSADRTFARIQAMGAFDGAMDKLAAVQPELATLGRLTFNAGFDIATQGERIRLNKLEGRIVGDRPVASLVSLQAIEINPSTRAITAADPATDLLRLSLDGLPLGWTKPFLGDLALTGTDVRGGFTVSARDGGLTVRPSAPITLTNLSVSKAGKPLVSGLDFSLSAQADYSPKGFSAEVTNFTVLSASAPLFKLTAKAVQPAGANQPLTVTGSFESDLAVVASQPVAADAIALKRGVARGEFTAGVSTTKTATFTLQLADLVADDAVSSPLPSVAMQARADIDASGRITAQLPVVITQAGRRSDLTLGAVVTQANTTTQINSRVTSDTLNLPDLMLFSALAPAAPASDVSNAPVPNPPPVRSTPSSAPSTPAGKPTEPLWAGVTGELQIALKKLVYSPQIQVADIGGAIKITPAALTWDNIHAALTTGGNLKVDGGLQFDAKQPQPYGLKTEVALSNFEPAPILRALSPGKPAAISGKFDLTTQLSGRTSDPAKFGENVIGDLHLTSNGGTIQALSMRDAAVADGVSKAAALVGLFGQLSGKAPNKDVEKVRAVAEVTSQLAKIPFDRFNVVAGRDEKNNFAIKDMTLHSPLLNIVGTGQVTYQPGVPFVRQPLLLTLKLGARDQLADSLRALKLIDGQPDKDGYFALVEDVKLDGSLQSIGTSQLSAMLKRALTN